MQFTELLDQLRIPYRSEGHEHCRPGWVQLDCPFCGMIGHFRLGYNLAGGYVNCWACGKQQITAVIQAISGLPWQHAKAMLDGIDRVRTMDRQVDVRGTIAYPILVECMEMRPCHVDYLEDRGFDSDEIVKQWGVKGIGPGGRLQWRLFIPIVYRGEVVSWTTRSVSSRKGGRYRSARADQEAVDHKSLLYGEDLAGHGVIVHEGPVDVWRTGPGAVATFGTAFTPAQVRRLAKYPKRVVCFDNTAEGQRQASKLCDALSAFPGETLNVRLDAKDAAEATATEIRELRALIA